MSSLEVLQCSLMQHKVILASIGVDESSDTNLITFYVDKNNPFLPHYTSIQIQVNHNESTIWRMVVDKGSSTCIISITCWKDILSPTLILSQTMLKYFDWYTF